MILFLAGTSDSRQVAASLKERGIDLVLSTFSPYGRVLAEAEGLECRDGALDVDGILAWVEKNQGNLIIDGTHPYAVAASQTALAAAQEAKIPYIRLERPEKPLPSGDWVHLVDSTLEAAKKAFELGDSVLLTTGSRTLEVFQKEKPDQARLVARILSEPNGVQLARELGFLPRDIIAMEGPFSQSMNEALIDHVGAKVMVMKDSGDAGGTSEKLLACQAKEIAAVVIARPKLDLPNVCVNVEEIVEKMKEKFS